MTLPRWLVVSPLSVSLLALFGVSAWWWVTWPQRTAKEFFNLLRESKWEAAKNMSPSLPIDKLQSRDDLDRRLMGLKFVVPRVSEIVLGSRSFFLDFPNDKSLLFTVRRGTVRYWYEYDTSEDF